MATSRSTMDSSASVLAPKKKRGISKKGKSSWRKNTNLQDVEDYLEDQRLEERLGGSFDNRPDRELFVIDGEKRDESDTDEERAEQGQEDSDAEGETEKKVLSRKTKRTKPLKCLSHLAITTGAKDPKKGRNPRRSLTQRHNPIIDKLAKARGKDGIIKAKDRLAEKNRVEQQLKRKSRILASKLKLRSEFRSDLWATPNDAGSSEVTANEWLEQETKQHTIKNTMKLRKKLPRDLHVKPSLLAAVEAPHGGCSYNPSFSDHQDLLLKAAMVELQKEKKKQRIEYHTSKMFSRKTERQIRKIWLSEMSEGIDVLKRKGQKSAALEFAPALPGEASEKSPSDDEDTGSNKPKTKKQRRKERRLKQEERKRCSFKEEKLKNQQFFQLKSIKKELQQQELETQARMAKRKDKKVAKLYEPATLSNYRYEQPDLDLKLSEELVGNLRAIKPEGNLLADRYDSLRKRNIIETRVKQKVLRNKHKRKKVEKRSHKMGFDWEK